MSQNLKLSANQQYSQSFIIYHYMMNVRAYQTQRFAFKHYMKLLHARSTINNSPSKKQQIPFSSRNTTHMTQYEQQLKTTKLVNKLTQIQLSNYNQQILNKPSRKFKPNKKNRTLTFSLNKTYMEMEKSLVNPFKLKEKKSKLQEENFNLVSKLQASISDYRKAFSKKRQRSLSNYSRILRKSRKDEQIRENFFETYSQLKRASYDTKSKTLRPTSSKKSNSYSKMASEVTRPQTAR